MAHRSLILASLLVPSSGWAAELLDEAAVIRLAREQAPASVVARAAEGLADARARPAGLLANPTLSWGRETVETGPVGSQDIVALSVPLEVARPLTDRALGAAAGAWARAEAALARADAVREALEAYHEAVAGAARVEVQRGGVGHLEEAARVLARREAAGSASGYESTRLAVALELARSQLADAESEAVQARLRLAGLLGVAGDTVQVPARLELGSGSAGAEQDAARALESAGAAVGRAEQAQARAAWTWVPALELGAGMKRVSDLGGGVGYVVGIAVDLPVFDRGQASRAEADATRALAEARRAALARRLGQARAEAEAALQQATQEILRFESQVAEPAAALLVSAQSGYREGERSVVELLDAQRAQVEVAERRVALLLRAKRAQARLRVAMGGAE